MVRASTNAPPKKAKKRPARSGIINSDRIVQAIASRHSLGEEKPARKLIMGMALMTNTNSFKTTILNIKKKKGHVDYNKDSVWLTQDGIDYVGPDALAIPLNNEAIHAKIRDEMVKGKQARQIFDLMLDGGWYTKPQLAALRKLPNNGSFKTYISSLSKVVEKDKSSGKFRLSDMVFPFGRPSV